MLERHCFCYKVIVNPLSNHTRVNIDIVCVKTVRTEKKIVQIMLNKKCDNSNINLTLMINC